VASLAAAAAGAAVLGWRFWAPLRAFLRGEPTSP
jgi:hypothetical protein